MRGCKFRQLLFLVKVLTFQLSKIVPLKQK